MNIASITPQILNNFTAVHAQTEPHTVGVSYDGPALQIPGLDQILNPANPINLSAAWQAHALPAGATVEPNTVDMDEAIQAISDHISGQYAVAAAATIASGTTAVPGVTVDFGPQAATAEFEQDVAAKATFNPLMGPGGMG